MTSTMTLIDGKKTIVSSDSKITAFFTYKLNPKQYSDLQSYEDSIKFSLDLITSKIQILSKINLSLSVFADNKTYISNCVSDSCKSGGGFTFRDNAMCYISYDRIYNLTHELTHAVAYHVKKPDVDLPPTLVEGIAQYVQGFESKEYIHSLKYEDLLPYYNEITFKTMKDLLTYKTNYDQKYIYNLGVIVVHWAITQHNYTLDLLLTKNKALTELSYNDFINWIATTLRIRELSSKHNIFLFTSNKSHFYEEGNDCYYSTYIKNLSTDEIYGEYMNMTGVVNTDSLVLRKIRTYISHVEKQSVKYAMIKDKSLAFYNDKNEIADRNIIIPYSNIIFIKSQPSTLDNKKLEVLWPKRELNSTVGFQLNGVRVAELQINSIYFTGPKSEGYLKRCIAYHPAIYHSIYGFFGRFNDSIHPIQILGIEDGKPLINILAMYNFSIYLLPKKIRKHVTECVIYEEVDVNVPGSTPVVKGTNVNDFNTTTTDDDVANAVVKYKDRVLELPDIQYRFTTSRTNEIMNFVAYSNASKFDYRYDIDVTCKLSVYDINGVVMPVLKLDQNKLRNRVVNKHILGEVIPLFYIADTDQNLVNFNSFKIGDIFQIVFFEGYTIIMHNKKWVGDIRQSHNIFIGDMFFSIDPRFSLYHFLYTKYPKVFVKEKGNLFVLKFISNNNESNIYTEHAILRYPLDVKQLHTMVSEKPDTPIEVLLQTTAPKSVHKILYGETNKPNERTKRSERYVSNEKPSEMPSEISSISSRRIYPELPKVELPRVDVKSLYAEIASLKRTIELDNIKIAELSKRNTCPDNIKTKEDILKKEHEKLVREKTAFETQREQFNRYSSSKLKEISDRISFLSQQEASMLEREKKLKDGIKSLQATSSEREKYLRERLRDLTIQNNALISARRRLCHSLKDFPGKECEDKISRIIASSNCRGSPEEPQIVVKQDDDSETIQASQNDNEIPYGIIAFVSFLAILVLLFLKFRSS